MWFQKVTRLFSREGTAGCNFIYLYTLVDKALWVFCLRTEPGPLNPELSTIKKATAPPSLVKDNSDLKALVAERFNRAIKNKIFKYDNKTLTLQYFRSWYRNKTKPPKQRFE